MSKPKLYTFICTMSSGIEKTKEIAASSSYWAKMKMIAHKLMWNLASTEKIISYELITILD